jgi:integrase/recombinase XerD
MTPDRGQSRKNQGAGGHHIEAFLEMLSAERGAASNTLAAYGRDLTDFYASVRARGQKIQSANADDVRAYMNELSDAGMAASTSARRLSAIRQFYRFLFAEGLRTDDPTGTLASPKQGRRLPSVLGEADVEVLLVTTREQAQKGGSKGQRLVALMEILYATGLRVSELVSLPLNAALGDPRFLAVRGKGGRERLVPLSQPAGKHWLSI